MVHYHQILFDHWYKNDKTNECECDAKYIQVSIVSIVPGLITTIILSMDDRLHGDIEQHNISELFKPVLTGQVFTNCLLTKDNGFGYKVNFVFDLKFLLHS